jgi:uncharacterized membrane protein
MDWPVVLKSRAPGLVLRLGLAVAALSVSVSPCPAAAQPPQAKATQSPALWDGPPGASPRTARSDSYMVQGVEGSDTLNIRARADSRSPLIGKIPPDGRGVRATGRRKQSGPSQWWEVSYGPHTGWVNARFLAPDNAARATPGDPMPPPLRATGAPAPTAPALVAPAGQGAPPAAGPRSAPAASTTGAPVKGAPAVQVERPPSRLASASAGALPASAPAGPSGAAHPSGGPASATAPRASSSAAAAPGAAAPHPAAAPTTTGAAPALTTAPPRSTEPPLEAPVRPLAPDPYAPAAAAGAPQEDLVCFLNQPIWRVELRKDGTASCTEMCKAPAGLRTTAPVPVKGQPDLWSFTLRGSDGIPFISLSVHRTGKCTDEMASKVSPYEVTVRRLRGNTTYKGCCQPLTPAH